MSKSMRTHSDPEHLLRYADQELSSFDADGVAGHLRDCPDCREELLEVRAAIGDYDWYHGNTLKPAVPPPPAQWKDLDFRTVVTLSPPPVRTSYRWAAAAAGLFLIVSVYFLSRPGRVDAAELLSRASVAGGAVTPPEKRIQLKTGSRTLVRPARMTTVESPQDSAVLRALFEQANYSWDDPFSARSFARWRSQLPQKEDRVRIVTSVGDRIGRFYEVRTTTSYGTLSEANLTLTSGDFRPVLETLKFRENNTVEITEALPFEKPERVPGLPSSRKTPVTEIGAAEELRVLAALARIGADVGEPIEWERSSDRITITGTGIDPSRQSDLRAALGSLPGVELRFVEPGNVTLPSGDAQRAAGSAALVSELEQRLGRPEEARAIVDRLLDQSDSSLLRAHALDKLAKRFPHEVEVVLDPSSRQTLTALWSRHLQAVETSRALLRKDLAVLLSAEANEAPAHPCSAWQECSPVLLKASQDLDQTLTRSLAGNTVSTGIEIEDAFARWLSALDSFHALATR